MPGLQKHSPSTVIGALKSVNCLTHNVTWDGQPVYANEIAANFKWVQDYDHGDYSNGHETSISDPFLLLVAQVFRLRITLDVENKTNRKRYSTILDIMADTRDASLVASFKSALPIHSSAATAAPYLLIKSRTVKHGPTIHKWRTCTSRARQPYFQLARIARYLAAPAACRRVNRLLRFQSWPTAFSDMMYTSPLSSSTSNAAPTALLR